MKSMKPRKRPVKREVREVLNAAMRKPEKYRWLFNELGDHDAVRMMKKKEFPSKYKKQFMEMRNETVEDWAKRNTLQIHGAKVVLMGTDHSHYGSWKATEKIVKAVKPDLIAVEDEKDAKTNVSAYVKIMRTLNKYGGDVKKMVRRENIQSLQRLYLLEDWERPLQEFNVERLHLNLIDSMAAFHMCNINGIEWYGIDLDSDMQEKKTDVGETYRSENAYAQALEMCYDVPQKYMRAFKIDSLYEFIQAGESKIYADATFVQTMLKKHYDPEHFTMLIHLRNIYMAHQVQLLAKKNPGKTILVLTGASHIFGIQEFLQREIPLDLIHALEQRSKSRRHLLHIVGKYGGSEKKPISSSRFSKIKKSRFSLSSMC